jgi:hypothetical protein
MVFAPRGLSAAPWELELEAEMSNGEVTWLCCHFLLNHDSRTRIKQWAAFVRELGTAFQLRVSVSNEVTLEPEEFLSVVRGSDSWRYFSDHYGWDELPG